MKYLLLLLLVSCSYTPKFKPGDCIVLQGSERWEYKNMSRVLEVGEKRYRLSNQNSLTYFTLIDDNYVRIPCNLTN